MIKKSIKLLGVIALAFSFASCSDEIDELLDQLATTSTYEEKVSLNLPDTTQPGEKQTLYTGHFRIVDLTGDDAPSELGGDISNAAEITIDDLFLKIESVQAITDNHLPEMSGRVLFFRADNYDESTLPADDISGSQLPEQIQAGDIIGSIETKSSDFKQGDRWTYEDGEGTFSLDIDKNDVLDNVISSIQSGGKVGVAVYMEYTGETPFSTDITLGITAAFRINLRN